MDATNALPSYCGVWDAARNAPYLKSGVGTAGSWYKVSHDGGTNLDGLFKWKTGMVVFFDGSSWEGFEYFVSYKRLDKLEANKQ